MAIDTNDVHEKEVEGLDSHIQVEKNGVSVEVAPEDKRHASTEQKSEQKCEDSGDKHFYAEPGQKLLVFADF